MEERITKEELLERLFHDDYENLKGKRLRLTRVRVPGKELSFAHVFTPSDKSVYENLALHIGVHEGEDHTGDAIGMVRVTPWEAIVVAGGGGGEGGPVECLCRCCSEGGSCGSWIYGPVLWDTDPDRRFYGSDDSCGRSGTFFP